MADQLVAEQQIMPMFLQACPSFEIPWRAHREHWGDEDAGIYNDLSVLARHLAHLRESEETGELRAALAVLEQLILEGAGEVQQAAIIGLIEDLSNGNLWNRDEPETIVPLLGTEARRWWEEVVAHYKGDGRHIGDGIDPAETPYLRWELKNPTENS